MKKKKKQKQNLAKETKWSKATGENEGKKKRKERDTSQTHSRCHSSATRERNPSQTCRCLNYRQRIPKWETATPGPPLSPYKTRPWLKFMVK